MRYFFFVFLLLGSLMPFSAKAAMGEWQRDQDVSVRLVSGALHGTSLNAGLEVQLAPEGHTYWRSPGETGLPPQITWNNRNVEEAVLSYPAPQRLSENGIETVGYSGYVVFPIDVRVKNASEPISLKASVMLLVCRDICLPKNFDLQLDVPAGAVAGDEAALIEKARSSVSNDPDKAGFVIKAVQRASDGLRFTVKAEKGFAAPDIFVETQENLAFQKPELSLSPDKKTATFTVQLANKLPPETSLTTMPVTATVVDNGQALEQVLDPFVSLASAEKPTFLFMILLAIMGGFILNLTPCVLPVLSLKILSFVGHGGGEHKAVRRSFLMTAAGILASFLFLAVVTILLKKAGHAVGWGVQFQQPVFLVFLIVLLSCFAANLWDFFEINLPRFLADRVNPHRHPKMTGDFASGAFATLLATPCSVPFLGTAVGFALMARFWEILIIFAALGFGMSLPFLAIAAWPRVATLMPKPGAWMVKLRRVLGVFLALTAVWLLYVLAAQVGADGAVVIGASMLGVMAALALRRRENRRAVATFVCVALVVSSFGVAAFKEKPTVETAVGKWKKFDESAITKYLHEGKTVFVNVTADWCVNCAANKRFTLSHEDVVLRLFGPADVVAMQADWTNPDPVIEAYLKKHGRFGIPFAAVYGPGAMEGLVLPELLTVDAVIEGLNKAENKPPSDCAKC